jgi:hypothetical protein
MLWGRRGCSGVYKQAASASLGIVRPERAWLGELSDLNGILAATISSGLECVRAESKDGTGCAPLAAQRNHKCHGIFPGRTLHRRKAYGQLTKQTSPHSSGNHINLIIFYSYGLAIYYFVHDIYAYHSPRVGGHLDVQLFLLFIFAAVEFIPLLFFYLMARKKHSWGLVALKINVLIIIAIHGFLSIVPEEFGSIRWFFIVTCLMGITALI